MTREVRRGFITVTRVMGRRTAYSRGADPVDGDRQRSSLSPRGARLRPRLALQGRSMSFPPAPPVEPSTARVWIVDDSPSQLERARRALGDSGWALETFSDGESALEELALGKRPDVLVLDWLLPGLSGVEVCRFLRRSVDALALPILVLTSVESRERVAEALDAGASDFLAKPYGDEELRARIRSLVRVREQAQRAERAEQRLTELLAGEQASHLHALAQKQWLHGILMDAPAAICILEGPEHRFSFANSAYLALVGRRGLEGRTVLEVMPEVAGQGFIELLDDVLVRGEARFGHEHLLRLSRADGASASAFLNFVYSPKRNGAGQVDGVLVFAHDVTYQVEARLRVESLARQLGESEERLRRVVDASGAGLWELEVDRKSVV